MAASPMRGKGRVAVILLHRQHVCVFGACWHLGPAWPAGVCWRGFRQRWGVCGRACIYTARSACVWCANMRSVHACMVWRC
jgi:hypothetical protein